MKTIALSETSYFWTWLEGSRPRKAEGLWTLGELHNITIKESLEQILSRRWLKEESLPEKQMGQSSSRLEKDFKGIFF